MMKKMLCGLLAAILLLIGVSACAEVPPFSDSLFKCAKNALSALASGAYEKLVSGLPFSDLSPSADEWQNFAEGNFSSLGNGVQTRYAVAYWNGRLWKVAVPVREPDSSDVETLVLISEDGESLSGYAYADWGSVESEYQSSDYVRWNEEYTGTSSVLVENDE